MQDAFQFPSGVVLNSVQWKEMEVRHLGCICKRSHTGLDVCLEMRWLQKHTGSIRKWGHPGQGSGRHVR